MNRRMLCLSLAVCLAAATGCPGRADIYDEPYDVQGPLPVDGRLVWSLTSARSLVVLDPEAPIDSQTRKLPFAPRALAVAGTQVIALGVDDEGPAAALTEIGDEAVQRVSLPAVFDRILPSTSGPYAVLLFDPSLPPVPGAPAARNANEIAVLSLQDQLATRVVLQTESLAPRAVHFSPVGTLAAVVLDSAVVVLDLANPERRVQVPLILPGGERLVPQEAHFASDGAHLFIRAQGTSDVLSLRLNDAAEGIEASINFLFAPGAQALQDILVPRGEGFEGTVAALFSRPANQGSIAALLDAEGDRSKTRWVELSARLTHIEDLTQGQLLLHAAQDGGSAGDGAALVSWQPLLDRVDEDRLAGNAIGAPAIAGKVAFFRHTGASGGEALTSVFIRSEATRDRVAQSPLVLYGDPVDIVADDSSATVLLGVQIPREDSGAAPDYKDRQQGTTGSVVLLKPSDASIEHVVLDEVVQSLGVVGDFFYAVHPDIFGDVTFFPKADPQRSAAHRRDGFLLSGLFEIEEDQ